MTQQGGESPPDRQPGRQEGSRRKRTVPNSTKSPFLIHTSATVPLTPALISLKIFMASIRQTVVSELTLAPIFTKSSLSGLGRV